VHGSIAQTDGGSYTQLT